MLALQWQCDINAFDQPLFFLVPRTNFNRSDIVKIHILKSEFIDASLLEAVLVIRQNKIYTLCAFVFSNKLDISVRLCTGCSTTLVASFYADFVFRCRPV